jgi:hypothetical protein
MSKKAKKVLSIAQVILLLAAVLFTSIPASAATTDGQWVTGDFHTHTYLSDGSKTATQVAEKAKEYGLDWYSATDHGGGTTGTRDQNGTAWAAGTAGLVGTAMPRWLSIFGIGEAEIIKNRNTILQFSGFEWNVPSHEHASVGMVGNSTDVKEALAKFDYTYDATTEAKSTDTLVASINRVLNGKADGASDAKYTYSDHNGALDGAKFLQDNYPNTSYFLANHPSRKLAFTVADFREFNDVAPTVFFGAELLPGHQKSSFRGGLGYFTYYDTVQKKNINLSVGTATTIEQMVDAYIASKTAGTISDKATIMTSLTTNIPKQRTYGGADFMLSKVGGLWDSMLTEGRSFWIFGNSDFHSNDSEEPDFWPGEYSKNYTFVKEKTYQGILDGMRSGNSYAALGDLINALDYKISNNGVSSTMGSTLTPVKGVDNVVTIRFKSPTKNYANTDGRTGLNETPSVDHIDLIAGEVKGIIQNKYVPGTKNFTNNKDYLTAEYQNDDVTATTKVIKTFTKNDWTVDAEGYNVMTFTLPTADKNMYYRLRGTSVAPNTAGQTDVNGNPLIDNDLNAVEGANTAEEAFKDLWFYTNPIFVNAQYDGTSLKATLVDENNSPLANKTVEIGNVSAVTDLNGAFTLSNIPAGMNTLIVKNANGDVLYQFTFNMTRGAKTTYTDYDLTVENGITITNVTFKLDGSDLILAAASNFETNPHTADSSNNILLVFTLAFAAAIIFVIKKRTRA